MIPTQLLRALSTIRRFDARARLMAGQACVHLGAAEHSRLLDMAVLGSDEALPGFAAAMRSLYASVIAVPPFGAPRRAVRRP